MDSNLTKPVVPPLGSYPVARSTQVFDLFGYFYGDRLSLLPEITAAFTQCGGWILERHTVSSTAMDFRFELQLSSVVELYGTLVALGIELTRAAHITLTDLCTCRKHIGLSTDQVQALTFRLEINFLADVTLHSILMTGSSLA